MENKEEVKMREIKFRAWDREEKKIRNVWAIDFVDGEPDKLQLYRPEIDGKECWKEDVTDFDLTQFTGLKDKNGKEIYEGDIVAEEESVMSDMGEDKTDYIEKRVVNNFKYADGKVGERRYGRKIDIVKWDNCGFEPFSDSKKNCGHCGGGKNSKEVEVIGNIYENKELLK